MKIVKKLFRSYSLRLFFAITGLLFTSNINADTEEYKNYPFAMVDFSAPLSGDPRYKDKDMISNYANIGAFAALKSDGSIVSWGKSEYGGTGAPTGTGFVKIYSNSYAFAALKEDGSIVSWGDEEKGGSGAPTDNGYIKIFSNKIAFTAIKSDGTISTWGSLGDEDSAVSAPNYSKFDRIYPFSGIFVGLTTDGNFEMWGMAKKVSIYIKRPFGKGFKDVAFSETNAAAITSNGSIIVWGFESDGTYTARPKDTGYVSIVANKEAYAALKEDGSIVAWGGSGNYSPSNNGYLEIYGLPGSRFSAKKSDGSLILWSPYVNTIISNIKEIRSNSKSYARLNNDGSIVAMGTAEYGGSGAPVDTGYTHIYSNSFAYAALKEDGSIVAWGNTEYGGTGAPTDSGYVKIISNQGAFVAYKADGTITAWGNSDFGGSGAPESVASINDNNQSTEDQTLTISSSSTTVEAGGSVDLSIKINNAQDLYGVQSTINVDKPERVNLSAITYGDFLDKDNRIEIPSEENALGQGTNEKFSIAISLKNPAEPVSGSGTFANVSYTIPSTAYGKVKLTPSNVVFSNNQGIEIASSSSGATITIEHAIFTDDGNTISGSVSFPTNINVEDLVITLKNSDGDVYTTTVDSDGNFTISDLKDGTYTIYADQSPYFCQCTTITVQDSKVVSIEPLKMLSGDINTDGTIDIGDVTLVASYFGESSSDIPSSDSYVDVNNDGIVNIQDLAIIGANFGMERCQ